MGFWERMKAAVGHEPRKGTGLELSRWQQAPPRRGTAQLLSAYREMPWLRACVDVVADSVAGVQWRVYRRVQKDGQPVKDYALRSATREVRAGRLKAMLDAGEAQEVPDHPVLKLLSDPNDHLTGRSVTKLVQVYLDLVGEAFLVLERVGGVPVGFWPVPPSTVTRLPALDVPREQRTYTVTVGKVSREIAASDVLHLRSLDPEDPLGRGIGPAYALGDELDTDEYVARFLKTSFWNNMLPPAIASIEGLSDANSAGAKAFKESLAREHQGPDKAGKLLITSGKVTFARLDTSFKDMQLVELRRFLMDFVRMTFRVPPEIVGDISSSNKATAFAARENLAEQATLPRMEFLRTEYQMRLMTLLGDDGAILDYDSPVPADREHQLRVMGALPEAFSYDEWRELAGLRPDPNRQGYPLLLPGQSPSSGRLAKVGDDNGLG
ncbi:phage portal protein [Myxococcus eversor]|uniref:phage portal protein n=1 Tax=Myxococcus eversor TaxID=2709661 RepID=UPI0013D44BC0|nr:phage portal protein [Myxococcus eversor]